MLNRDQRIDILRIFAAFWIILFHWWATVWGYPSVFPDTLSQFLYHASQLPLGLFYTISVLGDNAVPLFIIISAYCLTKKGIAGWSWLPKRLKKIIIPYWIALIGTIPLLILGWHFNPSLMQQADVKPLNFTTIVSAALLIQNNSPETFLAPVQAWWFIPILVQLYLLYPLLRLLQKTLKIVGFLFTTALLQCLWNALTIVELQHTQALPLGLRYSGPSYLLLYAIGMVLAQQQRLPSWSAGMILWIGGIIMRFSTIRLIFFSETLIGTGLLLVGFPLVTTLINRTPYLAKKLATLGERYSYPIFLWHQPLIYLLLLALLPLVSKPLITILPFVVVGIWAAANSKKIPFERSQEPRRVHG